MNIYTDPMLNVANAATYLDIPQSTLAQWKRSAVIHSVDDTRRGWPTLPFVAVVEAYVLRQLRDLGFTRRHIEEAADGARRWFHDDYGLARPGIGHDDGVEIFIEAGGELFRAQDHQQAIRETVSGFHECIEWSGQDPKRLRLARFGNVYLDPRFGWGRPSVAPSNAPISAIIGLWYAGEPLDVIAHEYDMTVEDVDALVRAWSQANDRAAA
ncbi:MAG: DUF433 domain-containing protein [Actinomycetia bacterium]|nr:DUF433 domain-containing protein [Actinomycetes bacterium]